MFFYCVSSGVTINQEWTRVIGNTDRLVFSLTLTHFLAKMNISRGYSGAHNTLENSGAVGFYLWKFQGGVWSPWSGVWIFSGTIRCKFNSILWNLPFNSQSLRDQLSVALENGEQVKEELQKLKEEIRAERASVQAARVIEKQKRELGIKRQVDMFNQSQEAVNQRVDSLITSMGLHSTVEVVINGVKHGETTNESFYMYCTMFPQVN